MALLFFCVQLGLRNGLTTKTNGTYRDCPFKRPIEALVSGSRRIGNVQPQHSSSCSLDSKGKWEMEWKR